MEMFQIWTVLNLQKELVCAELWQFKQNFFDNLSLKNNEGKMLENSDRITEIHHKLRSYRIRWKQMTYRFLAGAHYA